MDRPVFSFAGDQVAIAILVYRRTHSAFLTALAYLPPIAGGPLLSGLADLFPRRRVMIARDVLRIGTVGLMAVPGMPSPRCAPCCSAPCWPAPRSHRPGRPYCPTCCPVMRSC
jgi:MFS family permease